MPENRGSQTTVIMPEPIYSDLYTEKVVMLRKQEGSLSESSEAIRHSLSMNNAVGCIGGYYDDSLSMMFMSGFFMHNLGYDYERFVRDTGGSLRPMIYRDDLRYFETERFREGSGAGLFRMVMRDGTPIYVRSFKTESFDSSGTRIWVMAVRVAWDA